MLTYIYIKNFALIEELELSLQPELTILTGETGAGKSIIIDSLELALGGRADPAMIRDGTSRCEITAIFDITNIPSIRNFLIEHELDSDDECIIRRIISADGRSKSSINENPCTQQTLRIISELLINIHGQHEHQAILNPEKQRELVDAFSDSSALAYKVKQTYSSWLKTKKEVIELENHTEDYSAKTDYLTNQLTELDSLDFTTENLEKLNAEQKYFSNIGQILDSVSSSLNLIIENENGSIVGNLYTIKNRLEKCESFFPAVRQTIDLIQTAIIQVQEAATNLRQNLSSIEFNNERQKQIEEQRNRINDLARKHRVQALWLPQIKNDIEHQINDLKIATEKLERLKAEGQELEKIYLEDATNLSIQRKNAADKLGQLISEKMQILGMNGGKFYVNLLPNINQNFSSYGLERIEFLVSANPGQPLQQLTKIASGGELSRISLAIQVITAEKEVTPTLIFDEVDAGVGGKTAEYVGQLLHKLAHNTQVICITHLPQVAVQGQHHIRIEKTTDQKNTTISITTLNQNERIQEIARMLGGVKITKQTLAHAQEMLELIKYDDDFEE